jgi:hypothetical protein
VLGEEECDIGGGLDLLAVDDLKFSFILHPRVDITHANSIIINKEKYVFFI